MSFMLVTRRIEIDAGHRIMLHGSKCRHLHGHRYAIEATVRSSHVHENGEQAGMILDFGFLKEEMEAVIDTPCDHGFICALADVDVLRMFAPLDLPFEDWISKVRLSVERDGFLATKECRLGSKLYVIPVHPTAEELSRHWFQRLRDRVRQRSAGVAVLDRVRVWETPNCWAEYRQDGF